MIFKKPEKKTAYVQITKKELAMAAIKVVRDNVPESPEMQNALTWAMKVLEDAEMERDCSEKQNGSDLISRQDAIDAMWKALYAYEDLTEKQFMEHEELELEDWFQHRIFVQRMHEECMKAVNSLPSAEPKIDDENELKFYYVESLDDYWAGRRLDNFYYATWHRRLGFIWSHSKYLPWGEHIVDENTLWKEHTYPSEPIEIPFTEWIVGFVKKYYARPKTGEWIPVSERLPKCEQEVLICTEKKVVGRDAYIDSIVTPAIYEDGTMLEVASKWSWYDIDFDEWDDEEDCGIIPMGWFENRHFNPDDVYNNPVDRKVVAWMPLPEPYGEEANDGNYGRI